MAIYRVEIEIDAEGLTKEDMIDIIMSLSYKDWTHHVEYLTDKECKLREVREAIEGIKREIDELGGDRMLDATLFALQQEENDLLWSEEE
jgi:hypothetical protein